MWGQAQSWYARQGAARHARTFAVAAGALLVALCVPAVVALLRFRDIDLPTLGALLLVSEACIALHLAVAVPWAARRVGPAVALTAREDPSTAEVAAALDLLARLPARTAPRLWASAVLLAATPCVAGVTALLDLSAAEAAGLWVALAVAWLWPTVLLVAAFEIWFRPLVHDLAARLPGAPAVAARTASLRRRLLVGVPAICVAAAFFTTVLAGPAALDRVGPDVVVAVLVGGLAALPLVLLTAEVVAGPVHELAAGVRRVRDGDYATPVAPLAPDELGVLAAGFNRMAADLQQARAGGAAAREEERRRLARDLHDGLGPTLAALGLHLKHVGRRTEDAALAADLEGLGADVRAGVGEVRRLVDGLRPPVLDLGLVPAIERLAANVAPAGAAPTVVVTAEGTLPRLPAAVEAAALGIVEEALRNVVRHSGAGRCEVRVRAGDRLELEVRDDGGGLPGGALPDGGGTRAMRERAREVGGSLVAVHAPGAGTLVNAELPLGVAGRVTGLTHGRRPAVEARPAMSPDRLHDRLGPERHARLGSALHAVLLVLLTAGIAAALLAGRHEISAADALALLLTGGAGLGAVGLVAHRRAVAAARRVVAAAADGARDAAAWQDLATWPRRSALPLFAAGVVAAAVPATAVGVARLDLGTGAAVDLGLLLALAGAWPAVVLGAALEVWLRPVVRDAAAHLSPADVRAVPALALRRRLLVTVPVLCVAAAVVTVVLRGPGDLGGVGDDVALAVLVGVVTALPLVLLTAETVTGPVGELRAATERVRRGDLAARVAPVPGDELAGLATAVDAMTGDLERARDLGVRAREEERRRLARELHGGLAPTLAAVREHLQHAAQGTADARAAGALEALEADVAAAALDVRRLVFDLRPPVLDEIGLVAALERSARALSAGEGAPRIAVTTDGPLPPLPAAVEVAALRIAVEAMTNVVRHARAARCTVRLACGEALLLEVRDDGAGLGAGSVGTGMGTRSMRERAAELGGLVELEAPPEGGTRVRARLPLAVPAPAGPPAAGAADAADAAERLEVPA